MRSKHINISDIRSGSDWSTSQWTLHCEFPRTEWRKKLQRREMGKNTEHFHNALHKLIFQKSAARLISSSKRSVFSVWCHKNVWKLLGHWLQLCSKSLQKQYFKASYKCAATSGTLVSLRYYQRFWTRFHFLLSL